MDEGETPRDAYMRLRDEKKELLKKRKEIAAQLAGLNVELEQAHKRFSGWLAEERRVKRDDAIVKAKTRLAKLEGETDG